jgi:alkylation response protein AidB-like acyl-CoA dehydrogenase
VDFELSDDQQALGQAAADLLDGRSSMATVRAATERGGTTDPALWSAMVDQGWTGMAVPESLGGVGLGWVEAAVVLEQVGARVAPAPILSQLVALEFLADTDWGPQLLSGASMAAVAPRLGEPTVSAPEADVVLVPEGDRLVAIDLRDCRPGAEPAMDLTRTVGWLRGAAVAEAPRLDLGGPDAVERLVDVASVAYAAELLGLAQRALDLSVTYAGERIQFGRPIGSFQAVKHRCADMLVDVEGMRSAAYWAAWCVAAGDPDASVAASTAKCWCSDAGTRVLASALQVHGGIGFTWEHDIHFYLKRTHLDGLAFGNGAWHRTRLAAILRQRIEAGASVI